MIPKSLEALLGLCQRAGKAASGDLAVEMALKRGTAYLLVVAGDASERTQERLITYASRWSVPCYLAGTRDELGSALGKAHRAAVAIQSKEFANGITAIFEKMGVSPVEQRGWSGGT